MGKLRRDRVAKAGAVAILALISAGACFFTIQPEAKIPVATAAKAKIELSADTASPGTETVGMFAAIDHGDLAARLLPEKDQQARLELENRSDRPLTVEVPPGFGARFILAGVGVGGAGVQPLGAAPSSPGFFCIPPEKVGLLRVKTACLDESKPEPIPGMVYEVCRLQELTAHEGVTRLCGLLGDLRTDPRAVQAAIWHVNCRLTWRQLAGRLRTLGGPHGTQKFFTANQIVEGRRLAEVAMQ